jgi:hypothetical protein
LSKYGQLLEKTTRKVPEASAMPKPLCIRASQRSVAEQSPLPDKRQREQRQRRARIAAGPIALATVIATLIAAAPPFALAAAAQVNTGRIVGTVQDPSKAAIPQATVVVTDTATNQARTVLTSERGDFVVTPLNPGTYQVTVKMDGFQTAVVEAAEVQVGQSTRVDVELTLGALAESTIVTSATPLLDTESGTLGHVVTNT